VGVHNEIIKEGVNGFFAASLQEWTEKITILLRDKTLRERMGFEGRKTADSSYSLKANTPIFIKAIKGI
jgi:glycosyltransferase involved in cell wall biosynthesis